METTKDRFRKVLDELGIKPLGLASVLPEISKGTLHGLWASETGAISTNILEPFCAHYTNVNCNYLLRGTGPMFLEGSEIETSVNKYYEMCKMILENKKQENDLYTRIANMIGE